MRNPGNACMHRLKLWSFHFAQALQQIRSRMSIKSREIDEEAEQVSWLEGGKKEGERLG